MNDSNSKNVDVIIPTYNETHRLKRAIISALNQKPYIKNIIVIDDGSSVDVKMHLREIKKIDAKIIILENNHCGLPGVLRRKGINRSDSTWIAFLDSDDWWEPKKIEKQLKYAETNNVKFVATNAHIIKKNNYKELFFQTMKSKYTFKDIVKKNFIINSSVMVSRELLDDVGIYADTYQVRAVEDYATWLRILTITDVHIINEKLINYSDNIVSIRSHKSIDKKIYAYFDFLDWIKHDTKNFKKILVVTMAIIKQTIAENLIR